MLFLTHTNALQMLFHVVWLQGIKGISSVPVARTCKGEPLI